MTFFRTSSGHNKLPESGNVLFLILIAVALFAALSYAITQSGRGGGNVSKEQATIAASQITQHGAAIRSAVQRMIINGTPVYSPCYASGKSGGSNYNCSAPTSLRVFDPDGGGIAWQCPSTEQADISQPRSTWTFEAIMHIRNEGVYIKDLGTNTDVTGRDAVAHLWNVRLAVCQQINKGLGLDAAPVDNSNYLGRGDEATYNIATNVIYATPGEPFACVDNGTGTTYNDGSFHSNLYYHALIEQ